MNKDLEYYRKNAEENYKTTPISVLRYISELEQSRQAVVSGSLPPDGEIMIIKDFCKCKKPDRESGFSYCFACNRHISSKRLDEIIKEQEGGNAG